MKKFQTSFEDFVQHKLNQKKQTLQEQKQFTDAPPNMNDAPWHYPYEDDIEYLEEFRLKIAKTTIYGQLLGMYLGNIFLKYQDTITVKDWKNILKFCEYKLFNSQNYQQTAEAFIEIESKLTANKLERAV